MEEEKKNGMVAQIKAHLDVARQTNKVCTEFIKDFLNEVGGRYDFNAAVEDTDDGDSIEIIYDGGNHPEYASGMYHADAIYLDKGGNPCLELKYVGGGYDIDQVCLADLVYICIFILEYHYGIEDHPYLHQLYQGDPLTD